MSRTKMIHIGQVSIPLRDFAVARTGVLGITKSGKTYCAKGIAEQLMDHSVPIIVFDAIGVWRFLKRPADGGGRGYKVVVAGGQEPDLPLTPGGAVEIIRAAMKQNVSVVIDLYDKRLSKSQWRDIVRECFRTILYENTGVRTIILEETPEFAPQKILDGETYAEVEKLGRMGGNHGIGLLMIAQRSQEVNKAVLELCDNMILMRQRGSNAIDSLEKWMNRVDAGIATQIAKALPGMQPGECFVWAEDSIKPVRTKTKLINSLHLDRRDLVAGRKIRSKAVDTSDFVERLSGELSNLIEEQKANDPKTLREELNRVRQELLAKNAELTRALDAPASPKGAELRKAVKAMEAAMKILVNINALDFKDASPEEIEKALTSAVESAMIKVEALLAARLAGMERIKADAAKAVKTMQQILKGEIPVDISVQKNQPFTIQPSHIRPTGVPKTTQIELEPGVVLPSGETKVLIAVAQYGSIERDTITVLTGFKRATRDAYIDRLRKRGFVTAERGAPIQITEAGRSALPENFEPLPTGVALQQYWLNRLPEGERKIMDIMLNYNTAPVNREELSERTGYKRATRDAYLQRMRSKKIVEDADRGFVRLSANLFD